MNPFVLLGALGLCGLVLAQPAAAAAGFAEGLRLCAGSVLPALFPFFVVCELAACSPAARRVAARLVAPLRLLGLQSDAAPMILLLSLLGGYAVCAATVRRLRGQLSDREAALLSILGCCAGPGFTVGCVGGLLLGSVRLGLLLYGAQLAANLLCAAAVVPFLPPSGSAGFSGQSSLSPISLPQAIGRGVDSCLNVCGCVVFFRMAGAVLHWGALGSALLEVSAGCAALAALGGRAALFGCCFCISVLGLSVWAQLALLLDGCVPLGPLLISRALHCAVYPLLVWLCLRVSPGTAAVFSTLQGRVIPAARLAPDAAVITAAFLCAALYNAGKKFYNK